MSPGTPPSTPALILGAALWSVAAFALWLFALRRRPSQAFLLGSIAIFALAAAAFALAVGPRHDYLAFLEEWKVVVDGHDPWGSTSVGSTNAYGPLFVALAPLTLLHTLIPKLLFVAAWVGVTAWFVRLFANAPATRSRVPAVLAYFVLTPYFWVEIALYGHFDILPAIATVLAVHLALRGQRAAAGVLLGLGGLLKIAPLAALPLLFGPLRGRTRLIGTCLATVAVGVFAAYAVWGQSVFEPVSFAAERESRLLSIFQFLRGDYSPLRLVVPDPNLDRWSPFAMVVAYGLLVLAMSARRTHPVVAVMAAFMLIFALYTLGHPQFQMIVFLLAPYLYVTLPEPARSSRLLVVAVGLYLAWYSLFDVTYVVGGMLTEEPWLVLRQTLGLPTFLLAACAFVVLIRFRNTETVVPPATGLHARNRRVLLVDATPPPRDAHGIG